MAGRHPAIRLIVAFLSVAGLIWSVLMVEQATPATAGTKKCPLCDGPTPEPQPDPEPQGGEGRFFGSAALLTKDGEVIDSGAGSSCPDCEWHWFPMCSGGDLDCTEPARCEDAGGDYTNVLYWVHLRRGRR